MAGKLIQVDTETVSSSTASVDLVGTTTDDRYMVTINNMQVQTTNTAINMRFLAGGVAQSTSNYDTTALVLRDNASFANNNLTGSYNSFFLTYIGATNVAAANYNAIINLYDMNNSSQQSFQTMETATFQNGATVLEGQQGGGTYRVAEAHNGVQIFCTSGNIEAGTFTLFKIV